MLVKDAKVIATTAVAWEIVNREHPLDLIRTAALAFAVYFGVDAANTYIINPAISRLKNSRKDFQD